MPRIDDWPQQRSSPALWTESSHVTDGVLRRGALGIVADARRTGTRLNVNDVTDVTDLLHDVREDLRRVEQDTMTARCAARAAIMAAT